MKIRKLLFIIVTLAMCLLCSCNYNSVSNNAISSFESIEDNSDPYKYIPKERVSFYRHTEKVDDFDSDISVGYKNEDGTYTAYIFSSPIRYQPGVSGYKDIDNRLIKINSGKYKEKGYKYRNYQNDILSYFPNNISSDNGFLIENDFYTMQVGMVDSDLQLKNKDTQNNIWGSKNDTVTYSNPNNNNLQIKSYATKAGVRAEIILNEKPKSNQISLWCKCPSLTATLEKGGYILFKGDDAIQGIIRQPVVVDSYTGDKNELNSHLYLNNSLRIQKYNDKHLLTINLDKNIFNDDVVYPVTIDTSFEMHRSKLPDSAIYSNKPYTNQYLSDISVIGNNKNYGIGRNYSRLRINKYISDDTSNIKSAYYGDYNLTNFTSSNKISLFKVNEFWSSTNITWKEQKNFSNQISDCIVNKQGYYYFNITELVKKSIMDNTGKTEDYGILMKNSEDKNDYRIFSSSDNSLYPTFIEITFYKMPKIFEIIKLQ